MKLILALLSLAALGMVVGPSCAAFSAGTTLSPALKTLMLAGTLLWFGAATPLSWLRQPPPDH